jgi:hypothetical protein
MDSQSIIDSPPASAPKKILINYASGAFQESQRLNSETGLRVAGFDRAIPYGRNDVDAEFSSKNKRILSQRRGDGYWLWKPYFIEKALASLSEGDLLFYSDSGAHFIGSIDPIIEAGLRSNQDIVAFELSDVEKRWTKRDAFVLMNCDSQRYTDSPQRLASFALFRKSAFSLQFAREYLRLAQDARLITDSPNVMGKDNYPEFHDHRHDQSIFSLLTKIHNLPAFRDPSQWGNDRVNNYSNSAYGQLIAHTRKRHKLLFRLARRFRRTAGIYEDPVEAAIESLTENRS